MKNDRIRVSMRVAAPRDLAFTVFTEEIDRWWRHGKKFRMGTRSVMALEPGVGGQLSERVEDPPPPRTFVMGRVTAWEPPARLLIAWRAVNFAETDPSTEIEVTFERGDRARGGRHAGDGRAPRLGRRAPRSSSAAWARGPGVPPVHGVLVE